MKDLFEFIWPIALVLFSNTFYQICAKEVPGDVSPFASLTLTYLTGALVSLVLHFIFRPGEDIFSAYSKMNFAPYALGMVIVGLEAGWIFAYKAGWEVSEGNITSSALLAGILVAVGALIYKEPVTWNKITGIIVCLIGLVLINIR